MPPQKKDAKGAAAPTVMFGAMGVSDQKRLTHRSAMAPEEIRKVQSTGNLRGADGATARSDRAAPSGQPGTANTTGYTSDTALPTSARQRTTAPMRGVPWTEDEHRLFLLGLQKLGRGDWRGISRHYVLSRNPTQVASHAQKYFIRQSNLSKRKRRSSLFDIVSDVGPAPGQAGHIPHGSHMAVNGSPGIPPPAPLGRGKGAAVSQPHPPSTSPPLTAEGAAAMAVVAAGGTLPQGLPYFAYPPGVHPVHHVPMGVPNMGMPNMPNMPIMHALPWGYPGVPMLPYAMPIPRPVGATPERDALKANPKLCKPTASLATPNNWPLRFPFPGIPDHTAVSAAATTVASEVVSEVATTVATEIVSEVVAELPAVKPEGADSQVVASCSSDPSAVPMAASTACQPSVKMQAITSSRLYNLTERALVTKESDGAPSMGSSGGSTVSGRSMAEVLDEGIRVLRRSLDEGAHEVTVRRRSRSSKDGRRSRGPSVDEGHRSIPIPPG